MYLQHNLPLMLLYVSGWNWMYAAVQRLGQVVHKQIELSSRHTPLQQQPPS